MKKGIQTKPFDQFKSKPNIAKIKNSFGAHRFEIDLNPLRLLLIEKIFLEIRATLGCHLDTESARGIHGSKVGYDMLSRATCCPTGFNQGPIGMVLTILADIYLAYVHMKIYEIKSIKINRVGFHYMAFSKNTNGKTKT